MDYDYDYDYDYDDDYDYDYDYPFVIFKLFLISELRRFMRVVLSQEKTITRWVSVV
jgi:hypothetical protein